MLSEYYWSLLESLIFPTQVIYIELYIYIFKYAFIFQTCSCKIGVSYMYIHISYLCCIYLYVCFIFYELQAFCKAARLPIFEPLHLLSRLTGSFLVLGKDKDNKWWNMDEIAEIQNTTKQKNYDVHYIWNSQTCSRKRIFHFLIFGRIVLGMVKKWLQTPPNDICERRKLNITTRSMPFERHSHQEDGSKSSHFKQTSPNITLYKSLRMFVRLFFGWTYIFGQSIL